MLLYIVIYNTTKNLDLVSTSECCVSLEGIKGFKISCACVFVWLLQRYWRVVLMSSSAVMAPASTAPSSVTRSMTVLTTATNLVVSTVGSPVISGCQNLYSSAWSSVFFFYACVSLHQSPFLLFCLLLFWFSVSLPFACLPLLHYWYHLALWLLKVKYFWKVCRVCIKFWWFIGYRTCGICVIQYGSAVFIVFVHIREIYTGVWKPSVCSLICVILLLISVS